MTMSNRRHFLQAEYKWSKMKVNSNRECLKFNFTLFRTISGNNFLIIEFSCAHEISLQENSFLLRLLTRNVYIRIF